MESTILLAGHAGKGTSLLKQDIENRFPGTAVYELLSQDSAPVSEKNARVLVLPLMLIPGKEYEKLRCSLDRFTVLPPLLSDSRDMMQLIAVLKEIYKGSETLLLMGHGSSGPADQYFRQLGKRMQETSSMKLCTTMGALSYRTHLPCRCENVRLAPLMLNAGYHVRKDMQEHLLPMLQQASCTVTLENRGLLDFVPVRELFLSKLSEKMLKK